MPSAPSIGCCPNYKLCLQHFCFIPNLLSLLAAAYSVNLQLCAICGAICAIYRVLSQLQIMSTTLLLHPQPALPANSSLICNSATWSQEQQQESNLLLTGCWKPVKILLVDRTMHTCPRNAVRVQRILSFLKKSKFCCSWAEGKKGRRCSYRCEWRFEIGKRTTDVSRNLSHFFGENKQQRKRCALDLWFNSSTYAHAECRLWTTPAGY